VNLANWQKRKRKKTLGTYGIDSRPAKSYYNPAFFEHLALINIPTLVDSYGFKELYGVAGLTKSTWPNRKIMGCI